MIITKNDIDLTAYQFGIYPDECKIIFEIINNYCHDVEYQDLLIEIHRQIPLLTAGHFVTIGFFIGHISATFKAEAHLNNLYTCLRKN